LKQQEEESAARDQQIKQLGFEAELTTDQLETRRTDLRQLQEHQERTREQILQTQEKLEGFVRKWLKKAVNMTPRKRARSPEKPDRFDGRLPGKCEIST